MEPHEERLFRFRSDWAGVRKRISTADDFDWPRLCLLAEFVAWTESRLITGDLDEEACSGFDRGKPSRRSSLRWTAQHSKARS